MRIKPVAVTMLSVVVFATGAWGGNIRTDGSLGAISTLTGPAYSIDASLGQIKGNNLFHSFSQFDLIRNDSATFNGPAGTANIISRITGGPSSIDGTIRSTITGANLYLLNPAGILFGANAALDITGSFHATTADYLKLGPTGGIFYADPNNSATSITIDPPSAFGFFKPNPSAISVNGSLLAVPQGKNISLVAGGITVSDANLWASAGTVNLVSVVSPGEVGYNGSAMTTGGFTAMGPISITESRNLSQWPLYGKVAGSWDPDSSLIGFSMGNLDASGLKSGRVFIRGGSFYMSGATLFNDSYGSTASPAGRVDIVADGTINMIKSVISGNAYRTVSGAAISITADTMTVTDSKIVTDSFNLFDSQNGVNGTDITLKSAKSVTISGTSTVSTDTNSTGARAGNLTIEAPTVAILQGSIVSSSAPVSGAAGAGTITIHADQSLTVTGKVRSDTFEGTSGTINIETGALNVRDSGLISTVLDENPTTVSLNRAGDITITANSVNLSGDGRIASNVIASNNGSGGNIAIDSATVSLIDRSSISASIDSRNGTGGNISLKASDSILISSRHFAPRNKEYGSVASDTSSGNAGHINMSARNITISNGATVSTYGIPGSTGSAGNIIMAAADQLSLVSGFINTQSASSSGGNISTSAPGIMKVNNGEITASATAGSGNGGNITIDAGYLTLNNGLITARAERGNGGNLLLTLDKMFIKSSTSLLSASSRFGQQGTVVVNAPNTDVTGALAAPAFDILNLNAFIPKRCVAPDELNASTFRLLGNDGLPAAPENSFPIRTIH